MMESELIFLCKNNLYSQVEKLLLQKLPECIDVLYKDGLAFELAIKNNNLQMLSILVNYYDKEILQRDISGTTNYNISVHKLKEIIADALQSFDTSTEILEFLRIKGLLRIDYYESESEDDSDAIMRDFEIYINSQDISCIQKTYTEIASTGYYTIDKLKYCFSSYGNETMIPQTDHLKLLPPQEIKFVYDICKLMETRLKSRSKLGFSYAENKLK